MSALEKLLTEAAGKPDDSSVVVMFGAFTSAGMSLGDLRRVEAEVRAEALAKATEALRGYLQEQEGKVGELFVDGMNDAIDIVGGLADDARIEAAS